MAISMTITGDDENDFRRQLMRIAVPYLEGFTEAGGFGGPEPEPDAPEPPTVGPSGPQSAATDEITTPVAPEPKKGGRPKGSTNKPKSNGQGEPETQQPAQTQPGEVVEILPLAEQIQIITDAAHDQPDKFKPLLVPLREKLGVQYISKALEKDRRTLQQFIYEHGLAI
jgi:hypothetical protein